MKTLKFDDGLLELILSGEKDVTWRVNDEKNISKGDAVSFLRKNREEFAQAKVLWVKETTFGRLEKADLEGHEPISSTEELIQRYSENYNMEISLDTPIKVIKFELFKAHVEVK